MVNDYFDSGDYVAPNRQTLARAEQIVAIAQSVEAGFAKLPSETDLKQGRTTYGDATGSVANTYVISLLNAPASYQAGLRLSFLIPATNTGAATANVNGLGAVSIRRPSGSTLSANDMPAGAM